MQKVYKPTLNLENYFIILRRYFVVHDIDSFAVNIWLLNFYFDHLSLSNDCTL